MRQKRRDGPPPGDREVMTVDQVAAYLQLNRLTVYRYVREGKIPAAKFGKIYRILKADVDRFLESQKVSPQPARSVVSGAAASAGPQRAREMVPGTRGRSVWVRDVKSPEEISVGPSRLEQRGRPEGLILAGDLLEVVIRGLN